MAKAKLTKEQQRRHRKHLLATRPKKAKPAPKLKNDYTIDWNAETLHLLKLFYPRSWQQKLWNIELYYINEANKRKHR